MKLHLVSKRIYYIIIPRIGDPSFRFRVFRKKGFRDWLRWEDDLSTKILKRELNVMIGTSVGEYFGEWENTQNGIVPGGRALLKKTGNQAENKIVLGYTESGKWADQSD